MVEVLAFSGDEMREGIRMETPYFRIVRLAAKYHEETRLEGSDYFRHRSRILRRRLQPLLLNVLRLRDITARRCGFLKIATQTRTRHVPIDTHA